VTTKQRCPEHAKILARRSSGLILGGFAHDRGGGLAEVLACRCLLLFPYFGWRAFHFAFQFIRLPLRFIGFGTLLCHAHHPGIVDDLATTTTFPNTLGQEEP
jgi:hypothetical protein